MNASNARTAFAFTYARRAADELLRRYPQLEGGACDLARAGVDYDPTQGEAATCLDLLGPMGGGVRLFVAYLDGAWSGSVSDADGNELKADCATTEPTDAWVRDLVQAAEQLLA